MKVVELRTQKQLFDLIQLGEANHIECVPHLPCERDAIIKTGLSVINDPDRNDMNIWLCYKDGEPVGYCVGVRSPYFFNNDSSTRTELLYVRPEYRGTYAAIKMVKAFEEWSRLLGALQLFVGVARLDQDEAKKIRKLFPRMGYQWAGSYYIKET